MGNIETGITLNFLNALEIGAAFLDDGIMDLGIEWFEYGIESFKAQHPESMNFYQEILNDCETLLSYAIEEVGIFLI